MTQEEREILRSYRLEQADASLHDAELLVHHQGSAIGVINRAYYAMFSLPLPSSKTVPRFHPNILA
jgi:uncharacterized protein (UPF0332 family)